MQEACAIDLLPESADRPTLPSAVNVQSLSDEELLRLCAAEKSEAARELVRRYQGPLYRFMTRFLGPTDDAEQAVLNVFIRAWQSAPRFQFRSAVSTWLYRIATNLAHDMHVRQKSRPQEDPWNEGHGALGLTGNVEEEALERLHREDKHRDLERALRKMSESDRLILILYYLEERSYEEIQEIAGVSYKVLKTRLTRARQRLRAVMDTESESTTL